jgi:hypothetical protein
MENVLDVYKRPHDPLHPVVCMDESPKQLMGEKRCPIPVSPGQPARYDYEYCRRGVCTIFLACEPLASKRMITITERRTKHDWALFSKEIAGQCLNRRIDDINIVRKEVRAWQEFRNNRDATVNCGSPPKMPG